jgi:septum formation protein
MAVAVAKLILASASPRRRELLIEAGYQFQVVPSTVDEEVFLTEGINSVQYAEKLALAKALDVAQSYPESLVLGADTVVDLDGLLIGKPADAAEAEQITRQLFSRPHKVVTGVAIVKKSAQLEIVTSDVTTVFPRELTSQQIKEHIESGQWKGRAGAYGIKEQGDEFVDRIEGSLTNVMGFPMEIVRHLLAKYLEK